MESHFTCAICLGVPIVPTKIFIFNDRCCEIPTKRLCLRCARNFLQMNNKEKCGYVRCPFCNDPSTGTDLAHVRFAKITYEVDREMLSCLSYLSQCGIIDPFVCDCTFSSRNQDEMYNHISKSCPLSSRFCKICKQSYMLGNEKEHMQKHKRTIPASFDPHSYSIYDYDLSESDSD